MKLSELVTKIAKQEINRKRLKEGKVEYIELPNSNILFKGVNKDAEGNKVVVLSYPNSRNFSYQLVGNLPNTNRIIGGYKTLIDMYNEVDTLSLDKMGKEIINYIKKNGSDNQIKGLKVY